jgi:chromosome transmission fidelity protein 1
MSQLVELGQVLLNLTKIVPKGMVVFFPSYQFLHMAIGKWSETSVMANFAVKKKVQRSLCLFNYLES